MLRAISITGGALMMATTAVAQEPPADPAPVVPAATAPCELHVWPTDAVRSTYSGWFHGGIVDGAVQGRDGYKKLPDSILSPESQLRTIGEIDLPAALKLPGYAVVLHDTPLPSRVIRGTAGRLQADTPACYAELVTDDVFFQQDLIDGRFLKAIFRFRQFDGGETPTRTFGTYMQERLTQFPPEEPEQLDAALEEFRQAYGQAITNFGEALNRPPKKKKKK
jgi:hypothetical protein